MLIVTLLAAAVVATAPTPKPELTPTETVALKAAAGVIRANVALPSAVKVRRVYVQSLEVKGQTDVVLCAQIDADDPRWRSGWTMFGGMWNETVHWATEVAIGCAVPNTDRGDYAPEFAAMIGGSAVEP